MSDTSKRPGARDISDLKARLGLKKGAPGSPGTTPGNTTGSQPAVPAGTGRAGVVAPPGARAAAIPAPPGAQAPQPARPAIPDASQDPFGAMNAMAAHGAVAAQPQIVVVNDGQPIEGVGHKRGGARLALYAAIVLVPLILGSVVGKVAAKNEAFNSAIGDAAKLRDDVKVIGKGLQNVQAILQNALTRGPGGNAFAAGDPQLTTDLEGAGLVEPAFALLTQLDMSAIGDVLAKETMLFYSEAAQLNAAIKAHITRSKADQKVLADGQAKAAELFTFGAIVQVPAGDAPAGSPVVVKLAKLGLPICPGDAKPSDKGCAAPSGFQYRLDSNGPMGTGKVATAEGVGDGAMVLLDPGSKVLADLVKGGGASVAEVAYMNRVGELHKDVEQLLELKKQIETKLNNVANRDTRTTFFL